MTSILLDATPVAMLQMEVYYEQRLAHQGFGNKIINSDFSEPTVGEDVGRRSRLGGLMNFSDRKAVEDVNAAGK